MMVEDELFKQSGSDCKRTAREEDEADEDEEAVEVEVDVDVEEEKEELVVKEARS